MGTDMTCSFPRLRNFRFISQESKIQLQHSRSQQLESTLARQRSNKNFPSDRRRLIISFTLPRKSATSQRRERGIRTLSADLLRNFCFSLRHAPAFGVLRRRSLYVVTVLMVWSALDNGSAVSDKQNDQLSFGSEAALPGGPLA